MSQRILVSTRKGLFTIERRARWTIAKVDFLANNSPMALADARNGYLYAAFSHGHFGSKLHRSTDGGKTWREIAVPAYPAVPEGAPPELDMWGKPLPTTLQLIWSLEAGGPDQPGRLWCGTIPGGLFRSNDHGDSWELVRTLWDHPSRKKWMGGGADWPGIHSLCVDPRDSRRVSLGVSSGGVWLTEDDGATWRCRADGMRAAYLPPEQAYEPNAQDPHRLVQCRAAPEVYWVQHHNGIFHCGNDLERWEEIKNPHFSTFGFGVAVHPKDPKTAWFVPGVSDEQRVAVEGQVVVTRTRDGGQTFEVLRRGLPQEHAYDLTFRHALEVDETGDRLVFGTTTGSLFVSDDQGDNWHCVSTHLPPIYCTRFVPAV